MLFRSGVDSRIKQGVKAVLCLEYSMNARNTLGGTAVTQTCHQIEVLESFVREQMACLQVGRSKNE